MTQKSLNIEKPNNLKHLRAIKPTKLNRIAKIGQEHTCLMEENISFNNDIGTVNFNVII